MRIIVAATNIAQVSFCNKAAGYNAGGSDNLLRGKTPEVIRILICVDGNAIHTYLLTNIAGNNVGVITVLL